MIDSLINIRAMLVVVLLALLFGCQKSRGPTPPVIAYGQQECEECRMIISDARFAAAIVIDDPPRKFRGSGVGGGRFVSRAFDDIGCLLEHEKLHPDAPVAARYVADASDGRWLDAEDAVYLHAESLQTPMAFHVAALGDREAAVAMQREHPGDVLDLAGVRARFNANSLRTFASSGGFLP
jgi:copper chaperone NosL